MAKRILALSFFLLGATLCRAAFVVGQIRNAAPGTRIEMLTPQRYIDGRDHYFRSELDAQLQFSMEVAVTEPQLTFLLFNDDRLAVFLSPDDTLQLRADAFQFPLAVQFSGPAGANNRLLQTYLRQNPLDFNEFNNIRFKIGQHWASVELPVNDFMEGLAPSQFVAYMDTLRAASIALFEKAELQNPGAISSDFARWLQAEITYFRAYHLLVYGHVYAARHSIQADFFDFLYEAPTINDAIGSAWYRQFLQVLLARHQVRTNPEAENFWAAQYQLAGRLLSGKPLAFFRSEMISMAFSTEKYRELLPIYTHFLQTNEYPAYDEKVEGLYQKYAPVLPGVAAPNFETTEYTGARFELRELRGKVVYLNFWASWCGACLRKMEIMDAYESELAANGIEIVHVSLDENTANWQGALAERAFRGRHVLASAPPVNIAQTYGVEAIPQYFIIGRDGKFAEKAAGNQPADIRQKLLETAR